MISNEGVSLTLSFPRRDFLLFAHTNPRSSYDNVSFEPGSCCLRKAFRPGTTDLPAGSTVAAAAVIDAPGFGEFDDMGIDGVNVDAFSK